ncbi:SPOR domain-containing protein [Jannaschia sp. Os4]|uniref:SPOR domain-containing protein n=1 Tax=Jannaschia sp. Os4 TaxID=2807617 RepID=UPI00193AB5B2|nr:SPOR domain-containing protein [Jannaschia sp. Os4]MBM2577627.1 SPOR domain-containing protein [Jannaschia sp. Os4]
MSDMDHLNGVGAPSQPPLVAPARRAPAAGPAPAPSAQARFGTAGWAGAMASLAVTAGMAVWAVQLTMRDVSDVPVIRALEGPMRVAPENPGGQQAAYQGMALSDITSGRGAALAPDAVALAPDPIALDAAPLGVQVAAGPVSRPLPRTVQNITDTVSRTAISRDAAAAAAAAVIAAPSPLSTEVDHGAVADAIAATSTLATPGADPAAEALAAAHAPELLETTAGQPHASARPRMRPAGRPALAAAPVPADAPQVAAAGGVRDVEPSSIAPGTRVAQLGAFDSEVIAKREWERLSNRFPEYLGGKSRMIMKAQSGGRDFWRLRVVGFDDGDAARRFCSALTARNAACIPVTMR